MMRIIHWIIVIALVIAFPADIQAQGLFEEVGRAGQDMPFQLNGYGRGVLYLGTQESTALPEVGSGYGEAALKIGAFSGRRGKFFSEIRIRSGFEYNEPVLEFQLREAYADFYLGDFDLRVGQQIIAWGRADGFNPTNNLTPKDYFVRSPEPDDMQTGNFLLRSRYTIGSRVRLEGVWVPVYRNSVYRFDLFEMPEFVNFTAPFHPGAVLKNGSFAGKVDLLFDRFDGSLSWFNGYDPMPGIVAGPLPEVPGENPVIDMYAKPFRQQTLGIDFSLGLGTLGVRGEAAYRVPEASYRSEVFVPDPDLRYVLGIDRSFGTFSLLLQYSGGYIFDFEEVQMLEGFPEIDPDILRQPDVWNMLGPLMDQQLAGFNRIIFNQTKKTQHALAVRPAISLFHEVLEGDVFGMYNFTTREWMCMPRLSWSISDNLRLVVGGQYFMGPVNTRNDLIAPVFNGGFMELRYTF